MESAETIRARLADRLPELRARYPVAKIQIYGSVARGEATDDSDIDLLVDFKEGASLFDLVRLKRELEGLLGAPVDIATRGGMHPLVLAQAENDAIEIGA